MTAATSTDPAPEVVPSVLVVLVVRDAADRLRDCLQGIAAQTYPRVGILAVDDGSTDGSHEQLVHALGEGRVIRNEHPLGLARAFDAALTSAVPAEADFLLLLHDDAVLDPEVIARFVDATQLPGVERVGIVGAKVVDQEHPRELRDVGRSADRFGHPYSPLQPGEIDQGQFDRVLDVLSVDPCAMLVARDVWRDGGLFDERLGEDGALDVCWRARVAGWRVLMTPLARVRHRATGEHDERPTERSRRYEEDRAALATVLKNDAFLTLLWVVPLGLALTLFRLVYLTLSRRFEEAYDLLAAVGWNLAHLSGTLSRRRRVQRHRRVRDHVLRRFTESAGLRLPRWFQTAERILEEQREWGEEEADEPAARRLGHRTVSLVSAHPVIVASFIAALVAAVSVRSLVGPGPLVGGALPAFPSSPSGFFAALVSAFRTTPLGGTLAASPALGAMGGLSILTFGSTAIGQKVMLVGGPVLAGVLCYRAGARMTSRPGPSVVAAVAYVLSALTLSAFSDGRIALLVALAAMPPIVERLEVAFGSDDPPSGRWRFVAGLAVTIAVAVAFVPGVLLAVGVLTIVQLVFGDRRRRGLAALALALVGAAVLSFSFVPSLAAGGGRALGSVIGSLNPWDVLRLALGGGPGTWAPALFLPVAAVFGLALASGPRRAPALRAAVTASIALPLAWLSTAGYLPAPLANAPVYLTLAATAEALLVAFGLASTGGGLERESFGFRQIGTGLIALVLGGGILLQSVAAMTGGWAIGGLEQIPPAWAVVDATSAGAFRVLWLGAHDGSSFPAPGGDPVGVVSAGEASVTYGLTDRDGVVAIDTARPFAGSGPDALEDAVRQIVLGITSHGGALLAPFGVRYVVAPAGALPPAAAAGLAAQADLGAIPAAGLDIWSDASSLPPATVVKADDPLRSIVSSADAGTIQRFVPPAGSPLAQVEGGWSGPTGGGDLAMIATEYDGAWRVVGSDADPSRTFGWATALPVSGDTATIDYGAQLPRTIAAWLLAAVWAAALWITRKPVPR
ncbi:MAG TPA: glycosyltransferase [Actinomycetota bacterium]|nr:glycosyltransferase [Actinomycetota bacterium]